MKRTTVTVLVGVAFVLIFVGALIATRTLLRVPENSRTIARICEQGNEQSAKQIELWNKLIALPPSKSETPEERAEREALTPKFRALLNDIFAPQKCR